MVSKGINGFECQLFLPEELKMYVTDYHVFLLIRHMLQK